VKVDGSKLGKPNFVSRILNTIQIVTTMRMMNRNLVGPGNGSRSLLHVVVGLPCILSVYADQRSSECSRHSDLSFCWPHALDACISDIVLLRHFQVHLWWQKYLTSIERHIYHFYFLNCIISLNK
jgi:hypothetical protein